MGTRLFNLAKIVELLSNFSKEEKISCERELLSRDSDMSMRSGKKDTKMRIRAFPVGVNFFSNLKITPYVSSTLQLSTGVYICFFYFIYP